MAMKLVQPREMTPAQADCLELAIASRSRRATREELVESIAARPQALERGLTISERDVAVPHAGRIDLIGADAAGMLVVCRACERLDAATLAEAVRQAEWADEHRELLGRLCGDVAAQGIRAWIICAGCDVSARALLARMGEGAPTIFTHRVLTLRTERWLVLQREAIDAIEPVAASEPHIFEPHAAMAAKPVAIRSLLSEEEIGDFCSTDDDDEEITQRVPLAWVDEGREGGR